MLYGNEVQKHPSKHYQILASRRVVADGGANRLFDSGMFNDTDLQLPELVIGDLDSIRPEVMQFFKTRVDDSVAKYLCFLERGVSESCLSGYNGPR